MLVSAVTNSLSKIALDALIQRDVVETLRSSAFARSETFLQLSWVLGAAVGVLLPVTITVAGSPSSSRASWSGSSRVVVVLRTRAVATPRRSPARPVADSERVDRDGCCRHGGRAERDAISLPATVRPGSVVSSVGSARPPAPQPPHGARAAQLRPGAERRYRRRVRSDAARCVAVASRSVFADLGVETARRIRAAARRSASAPTRTTSPPRLTVEWPTSPAATSARS